MGGYVEDADVNDVVYLYGFAPADAPAPPAQLTGMAGAPVQLLRFGAISAAISHVPVDMYRADVIEARLEDLAWVGEQGMAHERVVLWFVDNSEILPARLFTLYSSETALAEAAAARGADIRLVLQSLSGRREWSLKVAYDAQQLAQHAGEVSAEVGKLDADIAASTPGRRYLLERKRADLVKTEVSAAARRIAGEMLSQLREHAEDARSLPAASGDTQGNVVLNAALLVHRDREAALREAAERLSAQFTALGMIVSFSGPWAPYRFLEDHVDT